MKSPLSVKKVAQEVLEASLAPSGHSHPMHAHKERLRSALMVASQPKGVWDGGPSFSEYDDGYGAGYESGWASAMAFIYNVAGALEGVQYKHQDQTHNENH